MSEVLTFLNLVAVSLQIACVAVAAAVAAAIFRIARPSARYAFWRVGLGICLVLPLIQALAPAHALQGSITVITEAIPAAGEPAASEPAQAGSWPLWLSTMVVAGVCTRLVWMLLGYLQLRRLRDAGEAVPAEEHEPLQATMRTEAAVRYADAVRQPVTFGVLRPVILLPASLRDHTPEMRHAILAHELLHVRRRDWFWVVLEEVVRSLFWFHPAMWWLISQVQHSREELVDTHVVAFTGRRREYIQALVTFADHAPLAPATAFARRRHLFRRIMLLSTEDVMSARRLLVSMSVMVLVVLAGGMAAIRAFPLHLGGGGWQQTTVAALEQPPGPVEQRAKAATAENPIPKRIYGEEPQFPQTAGVDASIHVTLRTIVDEAGNVAELRLGGFAFDRRGAPTPGELTGRALFDAFVEAAADAVSRWRFEPPRDGPLVFNAIAAFANGKATTSLMPVSPRRGVTADGAIRVGGNIRTPVKVRDVKPVYPADAKEARVQGVVILEVRIEPDGRVGDARVLRSIPMLDQAALDAVRQWEFMPTLLNGAPVPVVMTVTVQFSLDR